MWLIQPWTSARTASSRVRSGISTSGSSRSTRASGRAGETPSRARPRPSTCGRPSVRPRRRVRPSTQRVEERRPLRSVCRSIVDQRQQRVVQLVGVAHVRPGVVLHLRDRRRVERADLRQHRLRQHAPHLHRPRPPLLERRVVQIGVRIGVQNLVRERRRHRRVDREALDAPVAQHPSRTSFRPSRSIASVSTSFITSRMSG